MKCLISDCFRTDIIARFLCSKHHSYYKKHNNLDKFPLMQRKHGTGSITNYGYKRIYINGKRTLEHRFLIEKIIGRQLKTGEIIHHKDGNRLNNSLSNLELLNSQSDHITHFHNNRPRIFDWNIFIPKKSKHCHICKKINTSYTGLCTNHYRTYRYWYRTHLS